MSDFRITFDVSKKSFGDVMDALGDYNLENFAFSKIKETKPSKAAAVQSLSTILNKRTTKGGRGSQKGFRSIYETQGKLSVGVAILDTIRKSKMPVLFGEVASALEKEGYHLPTVQTAFFRLSRHKKIHPIDESRPFRYEVA